MADPHAWLAPQVMAWQRQRGRRDLPWQNPATPYRVWVSEIMLQQTQVATVIPYFQRFMRAFDSVEALAVADQDQVLALWSGLGYYRRARHLHEAAILVRERWQGKLPREVSALMALPGIGRSTAGAIASLAYGQRQAILDGNVRRVLARFFALQHPLDGAAAQRDLWHLAEACLPERDCAVYNQGLMDLGAMVCVRARPACAACPLRRQCQAYRRGLVERIPVKRTQTALREEPVTLLLLRMGGRLLMEKRPPAGIWGGLWCFPQNPGDPSGWQPLLQPWGCHSKPEHAPRQLATLSHRLSHRLLRISALLLEVEPAGSNLVEDRARNWLTPTEALQLGLPQPVRQLLETMIEDSS
jgi:A/G-specific adenine glycosylase